MLIVSQSGRFLAQIANNSGYPVWVADCFGDSDTLRVASRWLPINDIHNPLSILKTLLTLSNEDPCTLIYGTGIESFHSILEYLPKHIKLLGNSQHTVEKIKNPSQFFNILNKANIPYPKIKLTPPIEKKGWLKKSAAGFGGTHIQYLTPGSEYSNTYYQEYIDGISGSVLFLANGKNNRLLSINQQFLVNDPASPFMLGGIATPFILSHPQQTVLQNIIESLLNHINLYGLNSLDFIINEAGDILVLEVNPRPSASAELLTELPQLFNYHINACQEDHSIEMTPYPKNSSTYLHYIFARYNTVIPENISWPSMCRDIPLPGHLILKKAPLCTAIIVNSQLTFTESGDKVQNHIHDLLERR